MTVKDGKRVNAERRAVTIEFLLDEPTFQPHHMPFIKNLGMLGIDATSAHGRSGAVPRRGSTTSISTSRSQRFSFSTTPGDSLRTYFSSQAAATKGSQNLAGIADPAVDALVDTSSPPEPRAELITACRALDRVIRAGRYWIPHWNKASHWIAYWDVFGRPAGQAALCPRHSGDLVVRRDKAAKLSRERLSGVHRTRSGMTSSRLMTAYIVRRILLMIPTLFGIMLVSFVVVQFAPGGPVERVIAQLTGSDTGATSRISGSPGGDFGARGQVQGASQRRRGQFQVSRRAGPRSRIHQEPGKAVRLRQAGL